MAETLLADLLAVLYAAAFSVAGLAPFSTALTSILKRFLLPSVPAPLVNFGSVLLVFIAAIIAERAGYLPQFEQILETGAALLVALFGTVIGSAATYEISKALNVPVLGASRKAKGGHAPVAGMSEYDF